MNPAKRFAKEHGVPEELWMEIWKRYKLLAYSVADLTDYYHFKAGKKIERNYIRRWIFLGEVYALSKPARDMGAEVINSELFGDLEEKVIREVTKNLKYSQTKDSKIMA